MKWMVSIRAFNKGREREKLSFFHNFGIKNRYWVAQKRSQISEEKKWNKKVLNYLRASVLLLPPMLLLQLSIHQTTMKCCAGRISIKSCNPLPSSHRRRYLTLWSRLNRLTSKSSVRTNYRMFDLKSSWCILSVRVEQVKLNNAPGLILFEDQCDQIGRFWMFLATNLLAKVVQIYGIFLGNCKKHYFFNKNCCGSLLVNVC